MNSHISQKKYITNQNGEKNIGKLNSNINIKLIEYLIEYFSTRKALGPNGLFYKFFPNSKNKKC